MRPEIRDSDDENEAFFIHEIARHMRTCFDRRCQPLGLTRSQWHVLATLRRNEGINQAALAQLMEMEPISLTCLLDRMEVAEMIERRRDPSDRRANLIYLNPKAAGLIKHIRQKSVELRHEALDGFSSSEHKQLLDYLRRIKVNLAVMMGDK